jgi:hypothetical protein
VPPPISFTWNRAIGPNARVFLFSSYISNMAQSAGFSNLRLWVVNRSATTRPGTTPTPTPTPTSTRRRWERARHRQPRGVRREIFFFFVCDRRVVFEDPPRVCNGAAGSTPTASGAHCYASSSARRAWTTLTATTTCGTDIWSILTQFSSNFRVNSKATDKSETFSNFLNFSWQIAIYSSESRPLCRRPCRS